jgi:hypothetical protein
VVGAYSAHGALEGRVANVGLSSRHGVLMYSKLHIGQGFESCCFRPRENLDSSVNMNALSIEIKDIQGPRIEGRSRAISSSYRLRR